MDHTIIYNFYFTSKYARVLQPGDKNTNLTTHNYIYLFCQNKIIN
jgi:hypothetical protein